jgi:hypothetical protein
MDLVVGLLWGTLIGAASHFYLQWVIRKNVDEPPKKAAMELVNAYFGRYFMNIAALAVFYKHMWVLMGTGIGLLVMLVYTIIVQVQEDRKHPRISKRPRRRPKAASDAARSAQAGSEVLPQPESRPADRPERERHERS